MFGICSSRGREEEQDQAGCSDHDPSLPVPTPLTCFSCFAWAYTVQKRRLRARKGAAGIFGCLLFQVQFPVCVALRGCASSKSVRNPQAAPSRCTITLTVSFVAVKCRLFSFCPSVKDGVSSGCWLMMKGFRGKRDKKKPNNNYCWCKMLTFSTEELGEVCSKDARLCSPSHSGCPRLGFHLLYQCQLGLWEKHYPYSWRLCKLRDGCR